MKKIFTSALVIISLAACNTPNNVIGSPSNTTNTSGTTGSANITKGSTTPADVRNPAGTPTDTSMVKKDSLPR